MTEEDVKKLHKVTSKYTREHMFKMMGEREPIIKQKLSEIEAEEIETEKYIEKEMEELYPSEEIGLFPSSFEVVEKELKKYGNFLDSQFYNGIVGAAIEEESIVTKKRQENYTDLGEEKKESNFSYKIGTKKED